MFSYDGVRCEPLFGHDSRQHGAGHLLGRGRRRGLRVLRSGLLRCHVALVLLHGVVLAVVTAMMGRLRRGRAGGGTGAAGVVEAGRAVRADRGRRVAGRGRGTGRVLGQGRGGGEASEAHAGHGETEEFLHGMFILGIGKGVSSGSIFVMVPHHVMMVIHVMVPHVVMRGGGRRRGLLRVGHGGESDDDKAKSK